MTKYWLQYCKATVLVKNKFRYCIFIREHRKEADVYVCGLLVTLSNQSRSPGRVRIVPTAMTKKRSFAMILIVIGRLVFPSRPLPLFSFYFYVIIIIIDIQVIFLFFKHNHFEISGTFLSFRSKNLAGKFRIFLIFQNIQCT